MNLVDLISGQLTSGDVLGKLSGLVGADESQTRTATTAAVPALLQVFSKLASSNSGADQLARAMGGLDLGMLGNLAGALGGSQASGIGSLGGNLLGSLLGGGNLSSLVSLIASFAKMNPALMKTLLTYVAPIVLGMIAKQMGGRPDASGVSRLFSEQSQNISRALPQGLSLGNVLSAISPAPAPSHGGSQGRREPAAAGGMPGWLLPLLVLGAVGLGWYLWNENQKKRAQEGEIVIAETEKRVGDVVDRTTAIIEETAGKVEGIAVEELFKLPANLGEAGDVVKGLSGMFGDLTTVLRGVKDEAGAKAALPELEKFTPRLEELTKATGELPESSRSVVADFVGTSLAALQKVIDAVMAIPGVKQVLGPVVTPMVEAFSKLGK